MSKRLPLERQIRTLSNGMKVILIHKEDFSKSLFMIGIPAGGTNITDQINGQIIKHPMGCAHYLEHQMFRLNGEDVTYPLARVRAKTNACTSYDETCYYVWTNADPFEPLKLLIDFVQNLEISDESVNKEKGIILSEYSQYEQEPESRLLNETFKSLYVNHPMREDILGRPEDISNMTAKHLQDFYTTWYDPAQIVLVGITGHDLEPIFECIEEKEANYPSSFAPDSQIERVLPEEPKEVLRQEFVLPMDVDLNYVCIGVKLNPRRKDGQQIVRDDYMLNLWLNGMFGSMNPQFQTWLDTHLIGGMSGAEGDLNRDHGYILIYAQSEDPRAYIQAMEEVLKKKEPLSQDVFDSLLIREKASSIRLADRFEALAFQSVEGHFEGFDPLKDLEVLDSITLDDVTDFINSLDFSHISHTIIHPLKADFSLDSSAKLESESEAD